MRESVVFCPLATLLELRYHVTVALSVYPFSFLMYDVRFNVAVLGNDVQFAGDVMFMYSMPLIPSVV